MVRNHNHASNVETIANRIRITLLVIMIAFFAYIAISNSQGEKAIQCEKYSTVNLDKGEYEACLTVSTQNGLVTIPVTFVVENTGEFGTVNFNPNEKVENE